MLSQKARYALRALFVLTARPLGQAVVIAEIAAEARVPRKFLGRPPEKISFAEIIRAIDGPLALSPCVSVTAYRRCDDCTDEATCVLRKVLLAVRDATAGILENRTLLDALPAPAPRKTRRRGPPLSGPSTARGPQP